MEGSESIRDIYRADIKLCSKYKYFSLAVSRSLYMHEPTSLFTDFIKAEFYGESVSRRRPGDGSCIER